MKLRKFLEGEDKSGPHRSRKDEGSNDKKYFALMSEYKQLRRHDRDAANEILKKAQSLTDVSRDAKLGAAYL